VKGIRRRARAKIGKLNEVGEEGKQEAEELNPIWDLFNKLEIRTKL